MDTEKINKKESGKINQKVISKSDNGPSKTNSDPLNTGLVAANADKVAELLNNLLADEFVLYTKTLNFHWNVEGPNFHSLHSFLDIQYRELQEIIDSLAERIRHIGHFASGSMAEFVGKANLNEHTGGSSIPAKMIRELVDDHDAIIRKMRGLVYDIDQEYDDAGSADFITGLLKEHEKMAWMLRATVPENASS